MAPSEGPQGASPRASSARGLPAPGRALQPLTREALEQAARDAELAHGLAEAEQELKESSKSSNAGDGEGEERDTAVVRQRADDGLERRILSATPRSSRSSGGQDQGSSHHTSVHTSGHTSGQGGQQKESTSSEKSAPGTSWNQGGAGGGATTSSGSHSASASSNQQALTDLLERLTVAQDARAKADDDLAVLKRVMAETAAQHGVQVQELHKRLHKACKRSSNQVMEGEHATLLQKIASLEARAASQKEDLEHRLAASQAATAESAQERDDERDRVVGLEARHAQRMHTMQEEYKEELSAQLGQNEANQTAHASAQELSDLQDELAQATLNGRTASTEREQLRKDVLAQTAAHLTETSRLQGLLNAAHRELEIRGKEDAPEDEVGETCASSTDSSQKRRLKQLEAVIVSSRESHSELTNELSELRLQMLGMKQGHEDRVDDVQRKQPGGTRRLNDANKRLLQISAPGGPRPNGGAFQGGVGGEGGKLGSPGVVVRRSAFPRKLTARTPGGKLMSIDEEEEDGASMDGSVAASGNVSSEGSGEVGNLQDFEGEGQGDDQEEGPLAGISEKQNQENLELIQQLSLQLTEARVEKAELREDLAGSEAELANKVQRLTELLRVSREGNHSVRAEMASLKESIAGDDAARAAQLDSLRNLLSASETESETKDHLYQELMERIAGNEAQQLLDVDAVKQELFRALEARRIASNRLEDMRQELEATQRRCEQGAGELRQLRDQKDSMEGQLPGRDSGVSAVELEEIRERLRNALEERNVLAHTLEWKEVQWKSKIEHMELEHAELKRRQDQEVALLKKKMDDTVLDFKRKLDAAEQEKAVLARGAQAASAVAAPPPAVGAASWLALLRCPARLADAAAPHGAGNRQGAMDPAHCREVGWQLLGMVPTTIALLCDVPGLKVLTVTDGAKATWGEGLANSMVVSLLASPTSAAWLRRAIVTHQNLASLEGSPGEVPGFAIHSLGQLEFRDGSGRPFESSVSVAHLPPEPKLGKGATVVVVVEPLARNKKPERPEGHHHRRGGGSAMGGGTRAGSAVHSAAMSSVSDDVLPSDSASNIAMRYM